MNEELANNSPFKNDSKDPFVIQETIKQQSREWLNNLLDNGNGILDIEVAKKIPSQLYVLQDTETDSYLHKLCKKYRELRRQSIKREIKNLRELSTQAGLNPVDVSPQQISFMKLSDGSLAEMGFDPTRNPSKYFIIYYTDGNITLENSIKDKGKGIFPFQDDLPEKGAIYLPSQAIEYITESVLICEIQAFIFKYLQVSEIYEKIAVYYILLSWIYDNFTVLPYLRAIGDFGTGKSRFLKVIGILCYKPIFTGGATTVSPVFRLLEKYHGSLILDEGDFKNSECHSDFIKILNCGFEKGSPVLRSEGNKNNNYDVKAFDVYGTKIIGTRQRFADKALESRCITEEMYITEIRPDISHSLTQEFYEQALELRNKLLLFRFRHFGTIIPDMNLDLPGIEPRLKQIAIPLLSVITDDSIKKDFMEFIKDYQKSLVDERSNGIEATILEAIETLAGGDDKPDITVKQITDHVNKELPEDKHITSHKIGRIIRESLYLKTRKMRDGRHIVWDNEKIGQLHKRYGSINDES